jgi:hypothetical protein
MKHHHHVPEHRTYETHYFFDARMTYPSIIRGFAKTEESARAACVVKVELERYNKAVIVNRDTLEILHVFRRDVETGNIRREDHRYRRLLDQGKIWGALA